MKRLLLLGLVTVALLASFEPLALLLAAPWLVALVWVVVRSDPGVVTGEQVEFPSSAEDARRRLSVL